MKTMKKTHWLRTTICVVLICGILGTILSAVLFLSNPEKTYVSASIEFAFDGAADGIAPNGYAFDMSGIYTDEVLEKALADAGMADRYTPEQIRGELVTQGVYPEDIVKQMMYYESLLDFSANRTLTIEKYHPTKYSITLYSDFDPKISRGDMETLMKCILAAYKEYFAKVYALGANEIGITYSLENYDYPHQLVLLTALMEESAAYADELYQKNPTLRINGIGFNDISVRLRNLIDTDITRLNASITMNALTKNPDRLLTQYHYEINRLNNQLSRKKDELAKLDKLLASYDKNEVIYLSTSESLTKIDGNSSETYDWLVARRKSVADEITNLNSRIAVYQLRIDDLMKTGSSTQTATVVDAPAEPVAAEPAVTEGTEETGTDGETETAAEIPDAPSYSPEEIEAMAKEAEEASARQTAALEKSIADLMARREAIMKDFAALIAAYNEQQINDMTVVVGTVKYFTPSLVSGAFIKKTITIAGPLCAAGLMVCLVLMIISRKKEMDKAA